ncbi:MAG: hypothetical protein KIT27_06875 [Legionellales bacterium]|nr:hypothetical protein [Legionellales bacterium]
MKLRIHSIGVNSNYFHSDLRKIGLACMLGCLTHFFMIKQPERIIPLVVIFGIGIFIWLIGICAPLPHSNAYEYAQYHVTYSPIHHEHVIEVADIKYRAE